MWSSLCVLDEIIYGASHLIGAYWSLAGMSVFDTEVDGSNPGSSMLFP